MTRIYRMIVAISWGLGVLSTLIGVALKLAPSLAERFNTTPRAGVIMAGTLFLCALATREMERASSATAP